MNDCVKTCLMSDDIKEIKKDVKLLLAAHNRSLGSKDTKKLFGSLTGKIVATFLTIITIIVGILKIK